MMRLAWAIQRLQAAQTCCFDDKGWQWIEDVVAELKGEQAAYRAKAEEDCKTYSVQKQNRKEELDRKKLEMAEQNHIWLNAFQCVHPSVEFRLALADTIMRWLDNKERLLPATTGKLGALTPALYLNINKS